MVKKIVAIVGLVIAGSMACTNFLVTPGASVDGTPMISYAADSHTLYGALYNRQKATYPAGTMMDIIEWDTGHYLGQIPQATETYNVIGNVNEYGLAISETTWGGVADLQHQSKGIIDYGNLIYIALQRCKTAREAINLMTTLVATYGYASEGESFSLADPKEVWVLELIGKGEYELGAVWVARRVPDGYVTAHANQARIRQFPLSDPDNCIYSSDVISFAKKHGFCSASIRDEDFSFAAAYAPLTFSGMRGCDSRAWAFFRHVGNAAVMDKYVDYVRGYNKTNFFPWAIKPTKKISHIDMMQAMGDHFEGTVLQFDEDVGAGPYNTPYRWRPMDFEVNGRKYTNERSVATQQTGWVFVAQIRPNLPDPLKALNWFGVDDTACTVYVPFYAGITKVPKSYAEDAGADIMSFSFDSAFWVFNLVSQYAYTWWSYIQPEIAAKQASYQANFTKEVADIDRKATALINAGRKDAAITLITDYCVSTGDAVTKEWLEFFKYLFVKYLDGDIRVPNPDPKEKFPKVSMPGYRASWYERIAKETGDKYLEPVETEANVEPRLRRVMPWNKIY